MSDFSTSRSTSRSHLASIESYVGLSRQNGLHFDLDGQSLSVSKSPNTSDKASKFFGHNVSPAQIGPIHQTRQNQADSPPSLRGRVQVSTATKLKAGGNALAFTAGGAGIGAILGTFIFPGVGTAVGAAIGGAIGGILGSAGSAAKLKSESVDMLDTSNDSFGHSVQRDARWSWARTLYLGNLGRGLAQLLPLSGRSINPISMAITGTADVGRGKIHPVHVPIADSGRIGTKQDARDNLRYAAAMRMAQSGSTDANLFVSPAYYDDNQPYKATSTLMKGAQLKPWNYQDLSGPFPRPPSDDVLTPSQRKGMQIYEHLPQNLKKSIETGFGSFKDPHTGNHIRLMFDDKNNEVIMAHSGSADALGPKEDMGAAQWRGNLANYAGQFPPSVDQSIRFGKAVREAVIAYNEQHKNDPGFKPVSVSSVGHSRGGLMAQAEALANGGNAVVANSEPLGVGVRQRIHMLYSQDKPAGTTITQISTRADFLTDTKGSGIAKTGKYMAFVAEKIGGWGVPANAGNFVRFPKGDPGRDNAHADFFYQLLLNASDNAPKLK